MMAARKVVALVVAVVASASIVEAFLPPTRITNIGSNHAPSTSLFMGKKKKPSMKERRKQRAKKLPGFKVDRGLLDDLPPVDEWEKTQPLRATTPPIKVIQSEAGNIDEETEQTIAKASSLVELQRKSIEGLSFIRKRVEESFPMNDAAKSIVDKGYFVYDGFLSSNEDEEFGDALLSEMFQDSSNMLANDKLERDITRLGDGEFLAKIVGGEAYADCPRLTEYVVSLTRHLPPLFNKELDALEAVDISKLDPTASMGTLRLYDEKTRLGAQALLKADDGDNQDRPFGVVCGDSEGAENDTRRLTAMLFLSSKDWDASTNGGGVTIEDGESLHAVRDRVVFLRSDTCSHRQDPWKGEDKSGFDQASCVVVHFVKGASS